MKATSDQIEKLAPFVNGARPDERGEVEMYCPLHNDSKRSASLNPQKGVWFCHAGCGGGSIKRLIDSEDQWVAAEDRIHVRSSAVASRPRSIARPTLEKVDHWHSRLRSSEDLMHELFEERGLRLQTVLKASIGHDGRHYKIPVFSPEREIWNIRTYDMHPKDERRKIWSERGFGRARIYPAGVLERAQPGSAVILCEGEWDALLTLQTGYQAVTRTDGAGKPWHHEWDVGFAGLRVFLCHDRDDAGVMSDLISMKALLPVAQEVRRVELPYPVVHKHGQDLTDFLLEQDEPAIALGQLMDDSKEE